MPRWHIKKHTGALGHWSCAGDKALVCPSVHVYQSHLLAICNTALQLLLLVSSCVNWPADVARYMLLPSGVASPADQLLLSVASPGTPPTRSHTPACRHQQQQQQQQQQCHHAPIHWKRYCGAQKSISAGSRCGNAMHDGRAIGIE